VATIYNFGKILLFQFLIPITIMTILKIMDKVNTKKSNPGPAKLVESILLLTRSKGYSTTIKNKANYFIIQPSQAFTAIFHIHVYTK
jgi:hypothetical protein